MNPVADPLAGLHPLRDVAMPGWWPPAIGWWLLFTTAMVGLVVLAVRAWRRWQRQAYRRRALVELDRLEQQLRQDQDACGCLADVAILLKRVALAAYPGDAVAALQGSAWLAFLNATGDDPQAWTPELLAAHYRPTAGRSDAEALLVASRRWIQRHRSQP